MVSRAYIEQAARRCDTQVSRAFLKALGKEPPHPGSRRQRKRARYVNKARYRGMDECRRQTHGVTWRDGQA